MHHSPECYASGSESSPRNTDDDVLYDDNSDDEDSMSSDGSDTDLEDGINGRQPANLDTTDDIITDNLVLSFTDEGTVVTKADQISDYVYRDYALDNISVWEFVRHTIKDRISRKTSETVNVDEETGVSDDVLSPDDIQALFANRRSCRPYFRFSTLHPEHKHKVLKSGIQHQPLLSYLLDLRYADMICPQYMLNTVA